MNLRSGQEPVTQPEEEAGSCYPSWTDERAGHTALAKAQPGWAGQSKMQLFPSRDSKGEISAPPKEHARARARAPCCHLPSYLPCSPCLSSLPPPAAPPGRHQSFSPILT